MSRSSAREYALMVVYSNDVNPESSEIIPDTEESLSEKDRLFANLLVSSVSENLATIDKNIAKYLKNWSINQLNIVDKSILRLAIAEFTYSEDSSGKKIIINEAVELAKKYGGENSYRFINGILNAALRRIKDAVG